jgi:hypothetical protein
MNKIPCLTTSEVNNKIGLTLTSKFIIEKLKVEPVHYTSTSYLWGDVDEIRVKLAKYLIDSIGKKRA